MCDESAFNIKFVEYMEQNPRLYDFIWDDHSKRKELKRHGMFLSSFYNSFVRNEV